VTDRARLAHCVTDGWPSPVARGRNDRWCDRGPELVLVTGTLEREFWRRRLGDDLRGKRRFGVQFRIRFGSRLELGKFERQLRIGRCLRIEWELGFERRFGVHQWLRVEQQLGSERWR
jgi:hypothetical protein